MLHYFTRLLRNNNNTKCFGACTVSNFSTIRVKGPVNTSRAPALIWSRCELRCCTQNFTHACQKRRVTSSERPALCPVIPLGNMFMCNAIAKICLQEITTRLQRSGLKVLEEIELQALTDRKRPKLQPVGVTAISSPESLGELLWKHWIKDIAEEDLEINKNLQGNLSQNFFDPQKHLICVVHSVWRHAGFVTAACRMCPLRFGTTQDIPTGFYQSQFQDTVSLKLRSNWACQEHTHMHMHTHTCKQTDNRNISTKTNKDFISESERERERDRFARESKSCFQNRQEFPQLCVFGFSEYPSCTTPKYCTLR